MTLRIALITTLCATSLWSATPAFTPINVQTIHMLHRKHANAVRRLEQRTNSQKAIELLEKEHLTCTNADKCIVEKINKTRPPAQCASKITNLSVDDEKQAQEIMEKIVAKIDAIERKQETEKDYLIYSPDEHAHKLMRKYLAQARKKAKKKYGRIKSIFAHP